ncbi:MAG: DUF2752 domain-containing protein [Chloroflexi bacterium]|nr:DUF2752 domain-containing protein [Chloroflexota bacterium]
MTNKLTGTAYWFYGITPASRLLLIVVACIALAIVPLNVLDALPQFCLWERLFGYCPVHGTTHALAALLHGDLESAVAYNANVLLIAPLLVVIIARDLYLLLHQTRREGFTLLSTSAISIAEEPSPKKQEK